MSRKADESKRNYRKEKRLWNVAKLHTCSIGCWRCPEYEICGGLQLSDTRFDCLDFCCGNPETCESVCPRKPLDFAMRHREVDGFGLATVPRASKLRPPSLPALVPVIYHGNRRKEPFRAASTVCLSLHAVVGRSDGSTRYEGPASLYKGFRIDPSTKLILTGTDVDAPLERWWSRGSERRDAIRALRELGVTMVTTPNYSLFTDQPRWDDMYSMKRIAIVHHEFLDEGLPAALHVNARTERDWKRWAEYVSCRPEITHVAYEFATGAGRGPRINWHSERLSEFAKAVGRPLHLVVRGGAHILPKLWSSFDAVTVLNTSVFHKTMRRQRAEFASGSNLRWQPFPTRPGEPLDRLLADNWQVIAAAGSDQTDFFSLIHEEAV